MGNDSSRGEYVTVKLSQGVIVSTFEKLTDKYYLEQWAFITKRHNIRCIHIYEV